MGSLLAVNCFIVRVHKMIIHVTKKLAAKLSDVSNEPLKETSPLGSWNANLYTIDRRNCVLFCHDQTRYALLLTGLKKAELSNLGYWFHQWFACSLGFQGIESAQVTRAKMAMGMVYFDTNTDRSVQGSMRVAQQDLAGDLAGVENVMQLDHIKASARLNDRPVTIKGQKGFIWPNEAMKVLIESLG